MHTTVRLDPDLTLRIGEVAKLSGVTTRTLRYWEQQGLVTPTSYSEGGERLYGTQVLSRINRIRDLQDLLGFTLAEVRVIVDTDDVAVLDRVRSELQSGRPTIERTAELLDQAISANDQLISRLDDTLARLTSFRQDRVAAKGRLVAMQEEVLKDMNTDSKEKRPTR